MEDIVTGEASTSTALPTTPSGSGSTMSIMTKSSWESWDSFIKQTSKRQSTDTELSQTKLNPTKIRRTDKSHLNAVKDADIVFTSEPYAKRISLQIGRYFYSTNTPFKHAEHAEFRELCKVMRPGYKPPSRRQIGGQILDDTYQSVVEECKQKLEGQVVSMSLDGWSNIHNEPIVCCSIMTQSGDSYLMSTIDTSGHPHTAEYLKEVAIDAIQKTEKTFNVKVRSFVTDNTGNVSKMRKELIKDIDIIHYGCSAHILNLLAQDLNIPGVTEHILKVIKYFRNKHLPAAFYKEMKGKKLVMPQEVRWNTMGDAIKSYLDNRGILVQLCQDHDEVIDKDIIKIINDTHIIKNAMDIMNRLNPISIALDRMQRDQTTIGIAVEIWYRLEKDLKMERKDQPSMVWKAFVKRRDMALVSHHYLANMLDHRFLGQNLTPLQKQKAFDLLNSTNPEFVPLVMALTTKSSPFPKYLFSAQFQTTKPMIWWKSVAIPDSEWPKKEFLELCEQLFSAVAATAGLERIFSSFGLIQSKLRNRLGNEKASKLVFIFKYLNQNTDVKAKSLDWISKSDDVVLSEDDDDIPLSRFCTT